MAVQSGTEIHTQLATYRLGDSIWQQFHLNLATVIIRYPQRSGWRAAAVWCIMSLNCAELPM